MVQTRTSTLSGEMIEETKVGQVLNIAGTQTTAIKQPSTTS